MLVADLIILANVPKRYSYEIPESLNVDVGDYVDITFANRDHTGLCVAISEVAPESFSYSLSSILSIHPKRVGVPIMLISLVQWFASHYCVTEYKALQCVVGLKKIRNDSMSQKDSVKHLPSLSNDQMTIFNNIINSPQPKHLLHGVTGSGKTLIYAHLIQHHLNRHQSSIILIPEISLTPQFTSFFSDHFSNVQVVHSGLTPKHKEIVWNQCLRGEIDVIIGPRSAIFMPLENCGLIIVDEEHDASYKQESTPRYFTHEIAKKRAELQHATLIFGSATPSLVTFTAATSNHLNYHSIQKRFNNITLPNINVIDMSTTQFNFLIHDQLIEHIDRAIKRQKRVLLLVNRRGYSSFLKCNSCGSIQLCPSCETSYTYHSDGHFRCHRCLSTKKMTRQCMDCGQYDVEYHGVAIQKVAYELNRLFPKAKITRIDRDTVKNYHDLTLALDDVDASDILIGTQMIAKGHNFSNVAVVGILGVDTMLNFPDFRSTERMFQLMIQMAGRAGRDMSGSDVYIQTFQPNHYVFPYVKDHNVIGFLNQEALFRKPLGYPPYKSIANVIFSSEDKHKVEQLYEKIHEFNRHLVAQMDVVPIGPKIAPIEKASGFFRHNVFYKVSHDNINEFKQSLMSFPKKAGVRCVIDIDPLSLL
tara:strand:- start:5686 stop:7620 length:1935 start_codon:yes stop_codon:yes gene_type:complete